mgnify:CR=1 FL=1
MFYIYLFFFFQAEDGIRDLVRSRGLGDVYKRQTDTSANSNPKSFSENVATVTDAQLPQIPEGWTGAYYNGCLLYTSDAADERSSVDLGGRRIIKKKKKDKHCRRSETKHNRQENTNT